MSTKCHTRIIQNTRQAQVINIIPVPDFAPRSRLTVLKHQLHSTSKMSPSEPNTNPAPWRSQFLSHISKMTSPEFTFSTLHISPHGVPSPRARTCIYRGLWSCLPDDERNKAERNPAIYESDMPMFTTDVRMEKAAEVIRSAQGAGFVLGSDGDIFDVE